MVDATAVAANPGSLDSVPRSAESCLRDPKLETRFCQQPLKPARISGSLHAHTHANSASLQVSVKLLGFSFAVMQLPFTALARLFLKKCNLLKARVVIYAYQQHVRLLSPSLWSLSNHSLLGSRSRHCYAIKSAPCFKHASLRIHPMPSRTIQESHRPRVSDRTLRCQS